MRSHSTPLLLGPDTLEEQRANMGRAKSHRSRAPSPPLQSSGLVRSGRRRIFHGHIQAWAYDHSKRSRSFQGWITTALDSESYALRKPVACIVKPLHASTNHYTKVHLKLFKRRQMNSKNEKNIKKGRSSQKPACRKGATPIGEKDAYYAMIRSGSGWVADTEWFTDFARSQTHHRNADEIPYRLRSSSSTRLSGAQHASQSFRSHVESIKIGDWVRLGLPFSLLKLPKEVRLQIFDYVLQLPKTLLFDGWRQSVRGREKPRNVSYLRDFHSFSLVPSRQLHDEVSHLLYSTVTFIFHSVGALIDFLTNIGASNRASVRKICLQLDYYDYFDIFTPEWRVKMLDVPVWSRNRSVPRAYLSTMKLERLTIRLKGMERVSSCQDHHPHGNTADLVRDVGVVDKVWVYRSVLELCPCATFESDVWPHRRLVTHEEPWSWDNLMLVPMKVLHRVTDD